jgi:hypothetical protein
MTMQSKLKCGVRSPMQLPLFMVWREFYLLGDVVHAEVIFMVNHPANWRRDGLLSFG